MSNEQERLLDYEAQQQDRQLTLKERTANALESNVLHYTVIVLVFVDTSFVLADLIYTLLTPNCTPTGPDSPLWLEVLSNLSLAITTLFLLEIPFSLWALGFQHYNPVGGAPHASLHAFDAVVITTTFVLELALKGRERELAGLLVILRLWRLVKLVGGVAVGTSELDEQNARELGETKLELQRLQSVNASLREENQHLRSRLGGLQEDGC